VSANYGRAGKEVMELREARIVIERSRVLSHTLRGAR
jgi:hypothetical protein